MNVDLRLFDPFPELYEFAMKYDLDGMDDLSHAQVPFVAILIQVYTTYYSSFSSPALVTMSSSMCVSVYAKRYQ